MPQARRCETSPSLQMQIKSGRVHVFASMREAHGDMRLVGPLVIRKSRVTVDAKHRAPRRPRIGDEMRRDRIQRPGEVGDKTQDWLSDMSFVFVLVGQKPVAIVIALEAGQEAEKFGSEVRRH